MIFFNIFTLFFYLTTFMLGEKDFVWAQKSIGDLVSNAEGWCSLRGVNTVTYEKKSYGVNDLIGIQDEKVCTNVALLLLGCSYASTLRIVLFGYKHIIFNCQELKNDEEKFNTCTVDILRSLEIFYGLMDKIKKALFHLNDMKNQYEPQVINVDDEDRDDGDDNSDDDDDDEECYEVPDYLFGKAVEQITVWANVFKTIDHKGRSEGLSNFYLLKTIRATLKTVTEVLEKEIGDFNRNLVDPQYEPKLATWTQNFIEKPQSTELLFYKHLIEEVEAIISSAALTKYTNLGFVE